MNNRKKYRLLAIICYLLILFRGGMIGFPLIVWILFSLMDFGNINQLFALLAACGLAINYIYENKPRVVKVLWWEVISFVLLVVPLAGRMLVLPIEQFYYRFFIIPLVLFVVAYSISFYFSYQEYIDHKEEMQQLEENIGNHEE